MHGDQRAGVGGDAEEGRMRHRVDARVADDEVEAGGKDTRDRDQDEQVEDISLHQTLARMPNSPAGRARMKQNRITKATASLQPVESFHTARLSARPRIRPPKPAPRSEPIPPMMLAAMEMSTTRWPELGVRPVTQVATSAAGATSSEPIANAYCESFRGFSPKPRTRSGFSESARSATPTSVLARNQLRNTNSSMVTSTERMPSHETTTPPPMSVTRVSGVEIDTKLAPKKMTTRFSAMTPTPNEATNTVKNEPSSRWIGR